MKYATGEEIDIEVKDLDYTTEPISRWKALTEPYIPFEYCNTEIGKHNKARFPSPNNPSISEFYFKSIKAEKNMNDLRFFNLDLYEIIIAILVLLMIGYLIRLIFRNKSK